MIRSFADKDTERLFNRERVLRFQDCERTALRKLAGLHMATSLHDLRGPGASLEEFGGKWHLRISGKWRLSFVWENGDAYEVEITQHYR